VPFVDYLSYSVYRDEGIVKDRVVLCSV